jgi:Methyltransferase domain
MPRPLDPVCAALLDLAESELGSHRYEAAVAVAHLAGDHAPEEPGPRLFLANAGQWDVEPPSDRRAGFHLARGRAYRLLGDGAAAEAEFRAALGWNEDFADAHDSWAQLRLPGEDYLAWLANLHTALRPGIYLEIGVDRGRSLALAKPPTRAIGVDPDPKLEVSFETDTQIFRETSDAFFSHARLDVLPNGSAPDLAFIDGLHLFEQVLKDFMNVEAHSSRHSIVLIHDTIPLDEPTQRRTQSTLFYTGDVWKAVLCLKHYRPELDIITIATPPTGLTVITGLDPSSRLLVDRYEEAVRRFMSLQYADVEGRLSEELNVVANDWATVVAHLSPRQRGDQAQIQRPTTELS